MTEVDGTGDWHCVEYTVDPPVALVMLNRPERSNAWTARMEVEYRRALALAERDDRVGVIVLTGAGRHFCVGADTRAMEHHRDRGHYDAGPAEPLPEPGDPAHPAAGARHGMLLAMRKPVIAAVNGAAAGIGFVIACFADVRFVATDAKLTTATSRLGLPAEFGLAWILPRLIGISRALPVLLGSPVLSGTEAAAIGLAHEAVEPDQVLPRALGYARRLADECAPSSLRAVKRQVWDALSSSLVEADSQATELMSQMIGSPDYAEGLAALLERRPPNFPR